jgi:hypothetical protein
MPAASGAPAAANDSMSERFVIVHRTYDPIQADMLGDLLREAGLCARVTGTRSGALIGVAQNILEVHIAVPESQAGSATDFLESYFAADGEPSSDGPAAPRADDQAGAAPLRPLLAAGTAFLTFGVGHLYARRPGTAAMLLAGQLVAMAFLFAGDGWREWTFGIAALGAIVACDVAGAIVAVRAHRNGVRRGRVRQVVTGALYVAGALAVAQIVTPRLVDPTRGDPTGGWRQVQRQNHPLDRLDRPLQRDPSFPPLVSEHPANPAARGRP